VADESGIETRDLDLRNRRSQNMKAAKIFAGFLGLVLVGFGLACLLWPEQMLEPTGIAMGSATAVSELRSSYGGLQVGFGLALLGAAAGRWPMGTALMLTALIFGCIAIARTGSALVLGDFSTWTVAAAVFEIAVVVIAVFLAKRLRRLP